MLERYLKQRLKEKSILLMTHIVVGYPSFEASMDLVKEMVKAGVDLMELQIPFSEPVADGPVILRANQTALERGATVGKVPGICRRSSQGIPNTLSHHDLLQYSVSIWRGIFCLKNGRHRS